MPNVLSPHLWIGAFLLVWPHLLTTANELRIAVQAIIGKFHDVFLGSLIYKRLHRVARISLEQTCIPISNERAATEIHLFPAAYFSASCEKHMRSGALPQMEEVSQVLQCGAACYAIVHI